MRARARDEITWIQPFRDRCFISHRLLLFIEYLYINRACVNSYYLTSYQSFSYRGQAEEEGKDYYEGE